MKNIPSCCFAFTLVALPLLSFAQEADKTFSLSDVAKHATENDCWMAIEGKVYDLTDYIALHPAGPSPVVAWCGAEATVGMRTKELGDDHSPKAWSDLAKYLIGSVK